MKYKIETTNEDEADLLFKAYETKSDFDEVYRRIFWAIDDGSFHRLTETDPNVRAFADKMSEIYHSIVCHDDKPKIGPVRRLIEALFFRLTYPKRWTPFLFQLQSDLFDLAVSTDAAAQLKSDILGRLDAELEKIK